MVLDDLHTDFAAIAARRRSPRRQFIEQQPRRQRSDGRRPHRRARADAQEFTSNKRLLLAAVDKFMGRKLDSATLTRNQRVRPRSARAPGGTSAITDPEETERVLQRADDASSAAERGRLVRRRPRPAQDDALRQRRHRLRHHRHVRRARTDAAQSTRAASTTTRDAIAATRGRTSAIYGIDPRGLTDLGDETIERQRRLPDSDDAAGARASAQQLAQRTSCGCRRTACARCRTRPAGSRSSTATIRRPPSIASSRQQLVLRAGVLPADRTSATASSTRLKCG